MKKIYYRYESNEERKELVGIDVITYENGVKQKRGYYCGIELSLEDVFQPLNYIMLGIKDTDSFIRYFELYNAVGIVYFPATMTYGFLEVGDTVMTTYEELMDKVSELNIISDENIDEKYKDLDPEDPLRELYDLPLMRERTSEK